MKINKITNTTWGLLLCIIFVSCKNDYMQYDPNLSSVRFDGQKSLTYSFALHPGIDEDIVELPVRIIGFTSSQAREIGIEIDSEETTASNLNYELVKSEILADQLTGKQKIIIKKTDNLESEEVIIVVRLSGNEHFAPAPLNNDSFQITLTNRLINENWISELGTYSRVKHEFVITVTGKGTDYSSWSSSEKTYYVGLLTKALYEYNKEHPGEPLTDENNLPVTF